MKPEIVFALESAPWPALVIESSGIVRRANQAALAIFGAVMEEDFTQLPAIWAADNSIKANEFLNKQNIASAATPLKFKVKGGAVQAFSVAVSPLMKGEQRYLLFQLFAPAAAGASAEAKPEAIEANLAQKQKLDCALKLSRTVALDFNNALTSILGHTSLMINKMGPDSPWRHSLIEVEKSAQKAAEIAHDLAIFSRQEKDTRNQVAGNLNDLLRRVVDLFRKPSSTQTISWKLHLENRLYTANIDEAKMQQAIMKIVENAIQAVAADGQIIVMTRNREISEPTQEGASTLMPGRYVCIEISDNGCGIPSDVMPRIFEPFFTTKAGHRGLGLAWAYGIITNHGGSITVTSQPTQGASVRLYLPAQKKLVDDKMFKDEELRGNQTILMVDDEDLVLTMGQVILSSYGYRVLTASDGKRALDVFTRAKHPIDLVITDLVMPNMSGRELIERLRTQAPDVRIICSTGYLHSQNSDEDSDEECLQKPFTSDELLRRVKQALA